MKKLGVFLAVLLAVNLMWMGFVREPLPEIPEICAELSAEVQLDFSINTMDYTGIELGLDKKVGGKGMYVQFKMGNAWKTGRTGLVLNGSTAVVVLKMECHPKNIWMTKSGRATVARISATS
ncbi:MAG: hypothetical protein R2824_26445 [Saprospiraceae bacterium]